MQKYIKNTTTNINNLFGIYQLSKIAMALWLGGTVMTTGIILPIIFKSLDQITASNIASQILNMIAYIGVVCLLIALIEVILTYGKKTLKSKRFWYITTLILILIIDYFAVFPSLYILHKHLSKAVHVLINPPKNVFNFWHSANAMLFILISCTGIFYLLEI